jgi:hypothetical protein
MTMNTKSLKMVAAFCALALAPFAMAGTPLICFPFNIGDAKSLPWISDRGIGSPRSDYDARQLAGDTVSLLDAGPPVIVRMETLRRAALYAGKDVEAGRELLDRLKARAFPAKAGRDALALFDYGYFIETIKQANLEKSRGAGMTPDAGGYNHVVEALKLRGIDPEMEFAAALITLWPKDSRHAEHLKRAVAGARGDALLTNNLRSHFPALSGDLGGNLSSATAIERKR